MSPHKLLQPRHRLRRRVRLLPGRYDVRWAAAAPVPTAAAPNVAAAAAEPAAVDAARRDAGAQLRLAVDHAAAPDEGRVVSVHLLESRDVRGSGALESESRGSEPSEHLPLAANQRPHLVSAAL